MLINRLTARHDDDLEPRPQIHQVGMNILSAVV